MSFEFVPCAYLILYSTQNNRELSQILVDEHHKFGISRDEDEVTFKALCFIYLCSQKKIATDINQNLKSLATGKLWPRRLAKHCLLNNCSEYLSRDVHSFLPSQTRTTFICSYSRVQRHRKPSPLLLRSFFFLFIVGCQNLSIPNLI